MILLRPRTRQRIAPLLLAGVLALAVFTTPRWVVLARDASFDMQPAQRLATHGLSHTLYLGLGFVENKWGIRYDDDYGEEIADKADPPVVFCSPEYFRLMWKLYLGALGRGSRRGGAHLPREGVALLAMPTLYPGPPFGIVLRSPCSISWRRRPRRLAAHRFHAGLVVEGVSVAFPACSSPRRWRRCPARLCHAGRRLRAGAAGRDRRVLCRALLRIRAAR